ncbi:hypothetical protein PFDG_04987 [Plasmodium falciparum Dd2]|uniref:Secreted protein n=1 Tax=Plasmodium falciparum (isolate Dd2) TaxID=57267 RepID=A0A0L7M9G4_PLAF4|nr:hypothetical protein PFDG_04987 [Plasmodium falciparum Dd2]
MKRHIHYLCLLPLSISWGQFSQICEKYYIYEKSACSDLINQCSARTYHEYIGAARQLRACEEGALLERTVDGR